MPQNLQTIILKTLTNDEGFCRKVIPHIKGEYFEEQHQAVYDLFLRFITKYNKLPTPAVLEVEFQSSEYVNRPIANDALSLIKELRNENEVDVEWLLESTETWCKDRSVYLGLMEAISIIDGKSEKAEGAIPDILTKALSVNFDTNVGHDYLDNAEARYDFYHLKEDKTPFDLEMLNTITAGGVPRKSLNIVLAGTGVGKSLAMCHFAADALSQGRNVLYITMEMAEEKIAERIDANLFDVDIATLKDLNKSAFVNKVKHINDKTQGKLIIKEYPTASAHVGHFRALLNELKMKKKFTPDVIYIDYLNICASSRMKGLGGSINTYSYIKAIAEEIRGLAVEFNVPIWSATQSTRTGFGNTDVEITDTSESFGLPATCDLMIALISTEQLEAANQVMIKQLKNRYNDISQHKRFCVGIDRSKMRLYDVEASAQTLSSDEITSAPSTPNKDFSAFKI
jgi:archaellum biogenesis ATPase FlaH|tara:strand:- start:4434 stop:5798 length:1365 start_codon:yes stop_codon:yes gene_type:complete